METAELATNKLIILLIADRIRDITLNQLTTLSLETLYLDYFDFVTAYEELCRDRMISEAVRKNEPKVDAVGRPVTRCDLTDKGRTVLKTLEARIPLPIRSYLAQACSGWQKDIRLKGTLTADYQPDANGNYQVFLKQSDGIKDLVSLKLTIPEKTMAKQVCERWKRSPQTVYLGLLSVLTGETVLQPHQQEPGSSLDLEEEIDHQENPVSDHELKPDHRQQSLFKESD